MDESGTRHQDTSAVFTLRLRRVCSEIQSKLVEGDGLGRGEGKGYAREQGEDGLGDSQQQVT